MQAFANYQRNAYDDAINAGKRFVTLHPGHKDAPYAYYLIAVSEYEQLRTCVVTNLAPNVPLKRWTK